MSFNRSVAVAAAAAVAWLLVTTGAASAVTVVPPGSYSATASTVSFRLPSNGQTVTCSASRKTISMLTIGTGTIAAGDASFTSCTNALLGALSVSQPVAWTVRATLLLPSPFGAALEFTIPADGLVFTAAGCTYRVGGTFTKLSVISSFPAVVQNGLAVTRSSLTITSNNGGALCATFPVGLAVEITDVLDLDRSMTVNGPIVHPGGPYGGASGVVSFRQPSSGQAVTCTQSSKTISMSDTGTGIVAAGGAIFTSCSSPLLGGLGVTQPQAWPVRVVLLSPSPLGAALEFTIPADGLDFTSGGCTFRLGGTFTKLTAVSGFPAMIQNGLTITRSSLVITSNSRGPLCAFFPAGLTLTIAETLALDRPLTVA